MKRAHPPSLILLGNSPLANSKPPSKSDTTPTLTTAIATFTARHPPQPGHPAPTTADISFVRTLAGHIARRSASVIATSLHALWELKAEAEQELLDTLSNSTTSSSPIFPLMEEKTKKAEETAAELAIAAPGGTTTVAFNGSVVEQYPGYRGWLQGFVDGLLAADDDDDKPANGSADGNGNGKKAGKGSVVLVEAKESSLRGAAVALASLA